MRFLGCRLPRKSSFLGSLLLAHFAWRLAAKNYFLGGFSIFLAGFWPPRQFQILVVSGNLREGWIWPAVDRPHLSDPIHRFNSSLGQWCARRHYFSSSRSQTMLFILVMDVLNSLVQFATTEGLLRPLAIQQARHCVSFYADDAVIFLRPCNLDQNVIRHLT